MNLKDFKDYWLCKTITGDIFLFGVTSDYNTYQYVDGTWVLNNRVSYRFGYDADFDSISYDQAVKVVDYLNKKGNIVIDGK